MSVKQTITLYTIGEIVDKLGKDEVAVCMYYGNTGYRLYYKDSVLHLLTYWNEGQPFEIKRQFDESKPMWMIIGDEN